jgi:glycosyltransferase involved in cell wall biosynthesis
VTEPPLVSVVIPTYNHARFLRQALESVRAQTYPQWEAIVVNNHSEDDTVDVVNAFSDSRIRLINFHNQGIIASSRNEGIRQAAGIYVAFLDSDDIWYPEKLVCCVKRLESGCDLVCHGEVWAKENGLTREMSYGPTSRAQYRPLLYRGNCISTSATVVRKSLLDRLGGFAETPDFVTAEDYDLWLRIARVTRHLCFIPEMLGEFRIHGGNASKAILRNLGAELAVIESHFSRETEASVWTRFSRHTRYALAFYGAGRGFQAIGQYREALTQFWKAFKISPFIARLYAAALKASFECCLRGCPRRLN